MDWKYTDEEVHSQVQFNLRNNGGKGYQHSEKMLTSLVRDRKNLISLYAEMEQIAKGLRDERKTYSKLVKKQQAEIDELKKKYGELLFAVSIKHPDESRHETALRYIQQAEQQQDNAPEQQEKE